jgi:WD40-like Beta Propeller Repeat
MRASSKAVLCLIAAAIVIPAAAWGWSSEYSAWGPPQKVDEINGNSSELNTAYLDGCPIESPDGLSLYMASNRPRYIGDTRTDLDIWVAHRWNKHAPFGAPENVASTVNSLADDFCPTPVGRHGLFFVSRRTVPGSCGGSDIYFTRFHRRQGWSEPEHFACQAEGGPNGSADEQGPSYLRRHGEALLYFSSGPDIYVSEQLPDGGFGPAAPVTELNSTFGNFRPNVRRDGLEIVFDSNRSDTLGGQDLYSATRESIHDPWSTPVNLGNVVNTTNNETRGSFSRDAMTLYFGRAPGPEGSTDIYVSTRQRHGRR